jgi:hypothetical protein
MPLDFRLLLLLRPVPKLSHPQMQKHHPPRLAQRPLLPPRHSNVPFAAWTLNPKTSTRRPVHWDASIDSAKGVGPNTLRGRSWTSRRVDEYSAWKMDVEGLLERRLFCLWSMEKRERGPFRQFASTSGPLLSFIVVLFRYRVLLDRTYVDDSPHLRWCPHPECEYAVFCKDAPPRKLDQIIPIVHCACGNDFCFGLVFKMCFAETPKLILLTYFVRCGYAKNHQPLTCRYVKLWEKKCADDSETGNWLMANTKECTKCNATIEKNGGCK